jgi:hypothetical protein
VRQRDGHGPSRSNCRGPRSIVFWPTVKRIALVVALILVMGGLGLLLLTPRGRAQVNVTIEPSMTKGPATAKVTIVEFSDYQ